MRKQTSNKLVLLISKSKLKITNPISLNQSAISLKNLPKFRTFKKKKGMKLKDQINKGKNSRRIQSLLKMKLTSLTNKELKWSTKSNRKSNRSSMPMRKKGRRSRCSIRPLWKCTSMKRRSSKMTFKKLQIIQIRPSQGIKRESRIQKTKSQKKKRRPRSKSLIPLINRRNHLIKKIKNVSSCKTK